MKKNDILVVEDNYLVMEDILQMLKVKNYNVVGTASNGEDAIEKCCALKPDMVLMDLKMPKMNGLAASKKIQELCPTPIIILTAHDSIGIVNDASKVGIFAFLVKPPKIEEIDKAIIVASARHQDFMKLKNLNKQLQDEINRRVQSEDALKMIIEKNTDGIGIRQNEKLVFINKSFAKILGYSKRELRKLKLQEILSEESSLFVTKAINDRKERKKYTIHSEIVMQKKDQTNIDVEMNINKIHYNNQEAVLFQIRDITKQKELMRILEKGAEQTKGLNEFIPICASCHLIRDEDKENHPWVKPADYITERLPDIKFTHSICPDCLEKVYSELDMDDELEESQKSTKTVILNSEKNVGR